MIAELAQSAFRFAPSPNGYLHLGHAFSALVNFALAQSLGGRFLLRIEDIDPDRSRPEFEMAIYEDLAWLGLRWELPVRRQSEHIDEYAERLAWLSDQQLIYPCFCSRADLKREVVNRPNWRRDPDGAPVYPGTCRHLSPAARKRRLESGTPYSLRLDSQAALQRVSGPLSWRELAADGYTREVDADPRAWGDVNLAGKSLPASYHLAVVHDDACQGVTHVVRGSDLYAATALHRLLQDLFGLTAPVYRHHRLIMGADQQKLSKRFNAQALRVLRHEGLSPEQVRGRLGL